MDLNLFINEYVYDESYIVIYDYDSLDSDRTIIYCGFATKFKRLDVNYYVKCINPDIDFIAENLIRKQLTIIAKRVK